MLVIDTSHDSAEAKGTESSSHFGVMHTCLHSYRMPGFLKIVSSEFQERLLDCFSRQSCCSWFMENRLVTMTSKAIHYSSSCWDLLGLQTIRPQFIL